MKSSDAEALAECLRKVDIIEGKVDVIEAKVDIIETKVDIIEGKVDLIETKVDYVGMAIISIDKKIDHTNAVLERVASTMEKYLAEQNDDNANFYTRMGSLEKRVDKLEEPKKGPEAA